MKKKKGFFDDIEEPTVEENDSACGENCAPDGDSDGDVNTAAADIRNGDSDGTAAESDAAEKAVDNADMPYRIRKKRNVAVFSVLAVILCAFAFTSVAYSLGLFDGKYSGGADEKDGETSAEEFFYCTADYETDIFTIPEYLALDRRIKYAPDSSQSYLIENGNYAAEGEPGLAVLGEYLNAVIAGDHEKVNSLFTEEYLKENERHEGFPPQKLFEIKIGKVKEEVKSSGETVYIFALSYKIFRNDGLFRKNVDETRERAQLLEIIIYPDDTGRINIIKNAPAGSMQKFGF